MAHQTTHTDEKKWYAVHTYAGYENAVCRNLLTRVKDLNMGKYIFEVLVPSKKVVKINRKGKKTETKELLYPGYLLIEMIVNDESWYVVRNTPRVTGFIGAGKVPIPLKEDELKKLFDVMQGDAVGVKQGDYELGETVTIVDGPFANKDGVITAMKEDGRMIISVIMFEREVPVEINYAQIKKIR